MIKEGTKLYNFIKEWELPMSLGTALFVIIALSVYIIGFGVLIWYIPLVCSYGVYILFILFTHYY